MTFRFCESCMRRLAVFVVEVDGETFIVCEGCAPEGTD